MMTYFDNNATTPLDPRVLDAMLPWFVERHGNPSSAHRCGREAFRAVEDARQQVAQLLQAQAAEILFTSSGTEANNTVLCDIAERFDHQGHIISSALEHPSIRQTAVRLSKKGMEITELAPGADGVVTAEQVVEVLRPDTRLVCLMLANNELGTLQPVAEIASLCREKGVPVLCDAVQAIGKVPVDVQQLDVDFLVVGGHKFHGPPGVAALYVRQGTELSPFLLGAAQESGRRAGTENVPSIVGLGYAAEMARKELPEREKSLRELRDYFERGLETIPEAVVHCVDSPRLPHTCHVAFLGVLGHSLMLQLDEAGIAVSTGSACHSGKPQASRALIAMGIDEAEALASLRISFGMGNTVEQVDHLLAELKTQVEGLRSGCADLATL